MNIRVFDFKMSDQDRDLLHRYVDQILDEGYLTNHTLVSELEEKFSAWSDTQFNVAVNNGTSALLSAISALQVSCFSKKRKILLPSNTFIACWSAIKHAGFEPVLIDSNSSFLGMELNQVEAEIRSGDVAAVMVVHIGGIIDPGIDELIRLCASNHVVLIEDAAHAHGSHHNGKKAGSLGDMAAFSFHLTKAISGGEGGIISTNNKDFYDELVSIRQFGKSEDNPHLFVKTGGNYKMSEMQAALCLTDLARGEQRIARRREIAKIYFEELKTSAVQFFRPGANSDSSYYKCMALLPGNRRKELLDELAKEGIQMPNGVYYWPLHKQPVVKQNSGYFPNAEKFSMQHVCLPCYPELTNKQVFYFIDKFKRCEDEGLV